MKRGIAGLVATTVSLAAACGDNLEGETTDEPIGVSPPRNLVASDGSSLDAVLLTWNPLHAASSYRVWRDGVEIAHVGNARFEDSGAAPGTFTPPILTASEGTYIDRVQLLWSPPRGARGTTHVYSVTAVGRDNTESEHSNQDSGFRAEPKFIRWDVSIDGGQTFPILATKTAYAHAAAPAGVIVAGSVTASDGTFDTHVTVSLSGMEIVEGDVVHYLVRAMTTAGPVFSNPAAGYRGVGEAWYEWRRYDESFGIASSVFAPGATDTATIFSDSNAEAGRMYGYYCTVSALGAQSVTTSPDLGWRASMSP